VCFFTIRPFQVGYNLVQITYCGIYFQTTSTSIVLAVIVVLETTALLAFCQKDYALLTRLWAWMRMKIAALKKVEDDKEEDDIVTVTVTSPASPSSPSPPPPPPPPPPSSSQALPAPQSVRALPTPPPIRAIGYQRRPISVSGSSEW